MNRESRRWLLAGGLPLVPPLAAILYCLVMHWATLYYLDHGVEIPPAVRIMIGIAEFVKTFRWVLLILYLPCALIAALVFLIWRRGEEA